MMNYLYLLINIFTISIPLIRSFEPKIHYYKNFKALFLGILIAGTIFIIWDIFFTINGFWGFNSKYLTGITVFHLPIEEWMFFITVPFASVFIYEVLNYFLGPDHSVKDKHPFGISLSLILIAFGILNLDKWYTSITFLSTGLYLFYLSYVLKEKWLSKFFRAYVVILIPFFIVNGILTGTAIEEQIVWYNNAENLGIRIFTIPIEDSIYGMLLILINVHVLEKFRNSPVDSKF
ncbi:lycopene cyclase domain-containing protein [Hyphobacterium sp. CCMP332]|nr:lycopene cyclase domain-containing protein [Hyphobacterium sp. CCMP332]